MGPKTSKPKVVHLTSVHSAGDVRILEKECRSLSEAGYEVLLFAVGEKSLCRYGVSIHPIRKPQTRIRRVVVAAGLLRAAMRTKAAVYHMHDPELIPVGVMLKALGKRVIYDAHEDLPRQIMVKEWILPILRRPASWLSGKVLRSSSLIFHRIIAATPSIAAEFPSRKTTIVRNFPRTTELFHEEGRPFREREPTVVYVGGLTAVRGAREMVDAIGLVSSPGARLILAGEPAPELLEQLSLRPGWKRTRALGPLPWNQVGALLSESRVGLVLIHPFENYMVALPTKLFEYMSAGLPVIASDFPLWRQIVEDCHCGILVDPLSPQEISEAITYLLDHPDEAEEMGRRGRLEAGRKYDWRGEAEALLRTYKELAPLTPPHGERIA